MLTRHQKFGPWIDDAVAVLMEARAIKTKREFSGLIYCTLQLPREGSAPPPPYRYGHPIYEYLKKHLTPEEYELVVRMRDITRLEFAALSDAAWKNLTKTKKEKPYANTVGSLAGQS